MRIVSKLIGNVNSINFFLAIKDDQIPPYLLFTDALDSDAVILMFDSRALTELIKILHLARADVIKLEQDEERKE